MHLLEQFTEFDVQTSLTSEIELVHSRRFLYTSANHFSRLTQRVYDGIYKCFSFWRVDEYIRFWRCRLEIVEV